MISSFFKSKVQDCMFSCFNKPYMLYIIVDLPENFFEVNENDIRKMMVDLQKKMWVPTCMSVMLCFYIDAAAVYSSTMLWCYINNAAVLTSTMLLYYIKYRKINIKYILLQVWNWNKSFKLTLIVLSRRHFDVWHFDVF